MAIRIVAVAQLSWRHLFFGRCYGYGFSTAQMALMVMVMAFGLDYCGGGGCEKRGGLF